MIPGQSDAGMSISTGHKNGGPWPPSFLPLRLPVVFPGYLSKIDNARDFPEKVKNIFLP